ncbi:MAG TPA: SDR family oxidoreductase, partial [Aldersonia sp.]
RLVDAYLAIMQGEDHLTCTCERPDCAADPTPASRRKPLVQITIDAQTLLGLRSEPAFLPGHGPIDPDLARRLAQDATWQGILTELVDLAVTAGLLTPEQAGSEPTPQPHTEPTVEPAPVAHAEPVEPDTVADPEPDVEPDAEPVNDAQEVPDEPPAAADAATTDPEPTAASSEPAAASPAESALHARLCHPLLASFVARGTRRPSGYVPTCAPKPVLVPLTQADLYAEFTALLDAHPDLATGIHPDGHGGHADPPPGALTYRPSAEVAALVRARDRHCRFPHCSMPAERCQIDHITPFEHDDPIAGGWTIVSNLQCACAFHHELKTAGLWHARALPGTAILWTGPRGDRHLTLPAGGLTPVPAATDLTPDVGGGRAQTEPPEPEEPPPFEKPKRPSLMYGATKAAVVMLTKELALELAPRRIRVNAIAPGWVNTPGNAATGRMAAAAAGIPLGRVGEPDEIARWVAILASSDAAFMTGETTVLSGGDVMPASFAVAGTPTTTPCT